MQTKTIRLFDFCYRDVRGAHQSTKQPVRNMSLGVSNFVVVEAGSSKLLLFFLFSVFKDPGGG